MKLFCDHCEKVFPADAVPGSGEIPCPGCGKNVAVPERVPGPGCVIGDFLIEKALSKGGMGEVFLARQLSLDRPVALKVLQEAFLNDKEYVESLFREARAAGRISHPHIVQAYAVGEDEGIVYFAMEYIKGETLKQILKREGKLDVERAARIIREIASALGAAWRDEKLVHQDIKPDNIMLDANGFAKLADLGLAKTNRDKNEEIGDEVLGTPQYISPEQLLGIPTDVRSDIYSLGATFFHFVTGRFAYVGKDGDEIARQHVEKELTPPKEINPEIPDALNAIIMKMMAKDAKDRYQTPEILVSALDSFLHGYQKKTAAPAVPKLKAPPPLLKKAKKPNALKPVPSLPVRPLPVPPVMPAAPAKPAVPASPAAPPESSEPAAPELSPGETVPEAVDTAAGASAPAMPETSSGPETVSAAEPPESGQTADGETEQEETPDLAASLSPRRKTLKIALITVGVILLAAGLMTGCYFAASKVPFLKPYSAWIDGVIAQIRSRAAHSAKKVNEGQSASDTVSPAKPKTAARRSSSPKPEFRTRQRLVSEARNLLAASPRDLAFLKACDGFFRKYPVPLTPEEERLCQDVRELYAPADETLRMASVREKIRVPAEEKLLRLQKERAIRQQTEKARQLEEARRRDEEARRFAEAKKLDAARKAQMDQEIEARRKVVMKELHEQKKKLLESAVVYAQTGDKAEMDRLLRDAHDYSTPAGIRFQQEQTVMMAFQRFLQETPREAESARRFLIGLQRVDRDNRFSVPHHGRSAYVVKVSPSEIVAEYADGRLVTEPLTPEAWKKIYRVLQIRLKLKNPTFYLPLLKDGLRPELKKTAPNGYWRSALQEYFQK